MHPLRLQIVKTHQPKSTSVTPAGEGESPRRKSFTGKVSLVAAVLGAALAPTGQSPALGADGGGADPLAGALARDKPVICQNQTYALCAGASCFVFNNVAYCTCNVMRGNSISSPFNYDGGNICTVNGEGPYNGYMASTFSLPKALIAPSGSQPPPAGAQALYKCPRTSLAAYAKCDGGICFTSTEGHNFPGPNPPVGYNQIVCACPVERANFIQGLEVIGPYPCQKSFFQDVCNRTTARIDTGSILYDGTGIGSTETGTRLLYGNVPKLNMCP